MLISIAFDDYCLERIKLANKSPKTYRNYQTVRSSLLNSCGDCDVSFLTTNYVVSWKIELDKQGKQPSTIGSYLSSLREVLKYVRERNIPLAIDPRDITLPKIPRRTPTWLDTEEIRKILGVIESPRDKAIVALLFSSGARISELLSLNVGDIQNGQATIIGKGDKEGTLHFDDNALSYLEDYLETRNDSLRPLFISGQRRRITVSRVQQVLHEYADLAGIDKNVTPHVMRHSFASNLKMNDMDIYDIKEQLRHSQISSTMIYVHVNDSRKSKQYKRFHTPVPKV